MGVDFVGPQMGGFNDPNLGKYTVPVFADEECMHMTELVIGGGGVIWMGPSRRARLSFGIIIEWIMEVRTS